MARVSDGPVAGVVVFVRHALPGEQVVVEITEGRVGDRYVRGDAVEILSPSGDRVAAPCRFAGPGGCGGCDFQHVSLTAQRGLKAAVVTEQLRRLAGLEVDVEVEPVPGDSDGLGWRTRVRYAVADGRPGLRKHRSHDVVPVDHCLLAHPGLPDATHRPWPGVEAVEAIVSGTGEQVFVTEPLRGEPPILHERVHGDEYEVTGSGFWQVHPGAATTLRDAVVSGLGAVPGDVVADLYAGVGLFSLPLAREVGDEGHVHLVESDPTAIEDAARNLAGMRNVSIHRGRVERRLGPLTAGKLDLVVLDPPRAGARRPVVDAVCSAGPRRVVHVACDPASLARDVALFGERGYRLDSLRAFDLFPMTHHVECVAVLVAADGGGA